MEWFEAIEWVGKTLDILDVDATYVDSDRIYVISCFIDFIERIGFRKFRVKPIENVFQYPKTGVDKYYDVEAIELLTLFVFFAAYNRQHKNPNF